MKTKAKKRYLKAKKERRKFRKVDHAPSPNTIESPLGEEGEGESHSEPEVLPPQVESVLEEPASQRKPKKRRKLEEVDEEDVDTAKLPDSAGVEMDGPQNETSHPFISQPSAHESALPLFPLPTRPDAPSKSTLALQGQDRALIEAELVEPHRTASLADVGLGDKTVKRLQDLGIQELFAGRQYSSSISMNTLTTCFTVQTAVIPFLLSDKSHRALYLPFGPPRDICVSAPTGSGKTLAYVVPIVEVMQFTLFLSPTVI